MTQELKAELDRRVQRAQSLMRGNGVSALVAVCAGAPQHNGWIRYFTNAEAWGGRVFVLVRADATIRHIIMRSTYDAEWVRRQAVDTTVESTLIQQVEPVSRAIEIIDEITHGEGRVGVIRMSALTAAECEALARALPRVELVDLTQAVEELREIKSPFEIEAIRKTARLQSRALDIFADRAKPARLVSEVAGEVDGYLRGQGCSWGRVAVSFDLRPYRVPAPPGRRFLREDVVVFHLVQSGPLGYWSQTARAHSFEDLSADARRLFECADLALREAARATAPGRTYGEMRTAADRVFVEGGFKVVGSVGRYCDSMGADECDGRGAHAEDWVFRENMVLAIHPAPLLEGGRGVRLADTVLVQRGGGVSVGPSRSRYQRLEAEWRHD